MVKVSERKGTIAAKIWLRQTRPAAKRTGAGLQNCAAAVIRVDEGALSKGRDMHMRERKAEPKCFRTVHDMTASAAMIGRDIGLV